MSSKHYIEKQVGGTQRIYGPFESLEAARRAAFFMNDCNEFHRQRKANQSGRYAFASCQYEDEELASIVAEPSHVNAKKVVVRAKAPMHKSWNDHGFTAEFRDQYYTDSYNTAFGAK